MNCYEGFMGNGSCGCSGCGNILWLLLILCCCGNGCNSCICDILPLLLILCCCGCCGNKNVGSCN